MQTDACNRETVAFRHSGWQETRERVRAALTDAKLADRTLERFDQCGSEAHVIWIPGDQPRARVVGNYCRCRWCLPCGHARGAILAATIRDHMEGRRCKFVTLTLRHSDKPLAEQLRQLYACFARLRRRKFWTSTVPGGVAVLEVHHAGGLTGWHPHLHVIAEGGYIDVRRLSAEWHSITQTSFVVHVRACNSPTHAARYLTKYLAKPLTRQISRHHGYLVEAITALHGRRMLIPFGTWAHVDFTDEEASVEGWKYFAPLTVLLERARRRDREAVELVELIRRQQPWNRSHDPPGMHVAAGTPPDLWAESIINND